MKRFLLFATTVLMIATFVLSGGGNSAAQQGRGKPPRETTIVRALVMLADGAADTLRSDGRVRQDPTIDADSNGFPDFDQDMDGFGDLTAPGLVNSGPIIYQDSTVPASASGFHPDPCTVFDDITSGGLARARLDPSNCSVLGTPEDPDAYVDDARTFTMVFDRNTPGGSCACDTFDYLAVSGGMLAGQDAGSTYFENTTNGTCEVTPAAGPIVTDSVQNMTGSQQLLAWPFEDLQSTKKGRGGNGGESVPGYTSVHINFRTDRQSEEQANGWQLLSQGEIIRIETVDSGYPDTRVVSAEDDLFDLVLSGQTQCPDVRMTFQMSFTRFEVNQ